MGDYQLDGPLKRPKAVVFDTDNTLYQYSVAHRAAMEVVQRKATSMLGITRQEFDQAYERARRDVKGNLKNTASSHSRLLYFQRTVENLGLGTKILLTLDLEQTYWRTFLVNTKLFPGVKDFIFRLKSDGIITANITDLTAQIQFKKMVHLGLDESFDYVVTSEEAGNDKPHRAPFEIVLSKIGVDPSDIWMIGDDPLADIEGALISGMIPFQKVHNGVVVSEILKNRKRHIFKEFWKLIDIYCAL